MLSEIELEEKMSNTSTIALNNVMIAEFEKLNTMKFVNSGILNYLYINNTIKHSAWCEPHELSYNVSWEWLIPVTQKIKDKGNAEDFYNIRDCIPNKTDTYNAVVEFIKQYNNNKNG